ncbi:MAG: hypothetical protein OXC92_09680 [Flavobacteriaceae bacterium]|nr:hypothetical protein [Flavobacteriaceae bacterium]MCY4298532.1 hypothetical protein [Flavobacteriaceae bacterium]
MISLTTCTNDSNKVEPFPESLSENLFELIQTIPFQVPGSNHLELATTIKLILFQDK